ncbi:DUF3422 family protein [Beijerinckia indica]|uniref:Egg lysin n=1 Tax=Beijerinckia indica subsp. indica (strain ATCC 9039 / DSM 1715 / NCIMB 8712) TaxID=395963 RepID=B2IJL1_BEII9|nr:DUF3422 domain-containing protein [Beijerinckia indica]ACB94883.1 conserved hypothetical protein [Beijerinckia indica subsp. indica ATCC 9039]
MQPHDMSKEPAFTPHPLRGRVLAEVHARPFVAFEGSKRFLHFAFLTNQEAVAKARVALEIFCLERAAPPPAPEARHHRVVLSPAILRWEQHGEFTTYTWEFPEDAENTPAAGKDTAFRPNADELAGVMRQLPQPGPLMVAVDLHFLPETKAGEIYRHVFSPDQLIAAEVENQAAMVATDFQPDAFGFVRLLVLDRKLTPNQAGALTQRLLEVETYRTLALLGLPEAQEIGPSLRRIETELPLLMSEMRFSDGMAANQHLLHRLTALAAELEAGAAHSAYRFGATRAYHELMSVRLTSIGEKAISDLPTLTAFLARRLTPAIRTCLATETRQENLSQKLSRAAQLLRTRVEIDLESQNGDLLRKMNDRVRLQLQLQQTVEGLSIAAITYYIASILHLVFEGLHHGPQEWELAFDPAFATAAAVPVILAFVTWLVLRIRRHHSED